MRCDLSVYTQCMGKQMVMVVFGLNYRGAIGLGDREQGEVRE